MNITTPPMGWNSWNTFGENISEELIMGIADTMLEKGYKDAGYEYVVIDDCWSLKQRDENGKLVADPKKFPHGMKYVADYVHSKGLKFGMYSCSGTMTCAGYPASYGHEYDDAKTFAEWGIDFLKYDFCHFPKSGDAKNAYLTMSLALRSCGRDILFSACNWGACESWTWMRSVGAHMYRSTGDLFDSFVAYRDIVNSQENNFSMSAPNCFNDMDMLIVGMYGDGNVGIKSGCTDDEYEMHFALWCMYGTPLMIGGDIRNVNEFSRKLMQNKELIEINQDAESRPPVHFGYANTGANGDNRVLFKLLSNNEYVIGFFNYSDSDMEMSVNFTDIGIPYNSGMALDLHNVITGQNLGLIRDYYMEKVKTHSCIILKGKLTKI